MIRIGLLTSGGDCQALNAAMRGVAKGLLNSDQDVELYGPMPSMVYKVQKRYRMNIFVKGSKKKIDSFKKFLKKKLKEFNDTKVRIVVDIDPVNLM